MSYDPEKPDAGGSILDMSDLALAEILISRNRGIVRFVPEWGKWLVWQGTHWQVDAHNIVAGMTHDVLIDFAKRAADQRFATLMSSGKLAPSENDRTDERAQKKRAARRQAIASIAHYKSANKKSGVMQVASERPKATVSVSGLDAEEWLLNTPTGVVDLRDGSLHAHKPDMMITKITRVGMSDERPVGWLRFLDQITAGDTALQTYLQRVAGYCLTGTTHAQTLFFGFGSGANGKSVFVNTLSALLKDYYANAEIETFLDLGGQNRHSTEVANLQGARFVTASETQSGRKWNESRIKQMTGGDPITARFIYKDVFTYMPQFKLFIIGNHRPRLSAVNEAIKRRMQLIPFVVTFPKEQQNAYLRDQLLANEAGSILRWAVEGCIEYRRVGLDPPPAVLKATDDYLNAEDVMAQWLEECCTWDVNAKIPARDLFRSWTNWAVNTNEIIGHGRDFKLALFEHAGENFLDHKVARYEGKNAQCYIGIDLIEKPLKKKQLPEKFREKYG